MAAGSSPLCDVCGLLTISDRRRRARRTGARLRRAALARRRLSRFSGLARLARRAARSDAGAARAARRARDFLARLPRIAEQSEDAAVLRGVPAVVRRRLGKRRRAARDPERHLRHAGASPRRRLGAAGGAPARRARRQRPFAQPPERRGVDRRGTGAGARAQIVSAHKQLVINTIL